LFNFRKVKKVQFIPFIAALASESFLLSVGGLERDALLFFRLYCLNCNLVCSFTKLLWKAYEYCATEFIGANNCFTQSLINNCARVLCNELRVANKVAQLHFVDFINLKAPHV